MPFGELFEATGDDAVRVHRIEDAQIVTENVGFLGRRLLTRQGRGGFEIYVLDLGAGARHDAGRTRPASSSMSW